MCLTIQVRLVIKMKTIVAKADLENEEVFRKASDILNSGGLVAFPTETVYGLGGDALNPKASEKIYSAKGRPSDNPLIVHIADTASVWELAAEVSTQAQMLMEAFWPGPLTIIFKKKDIVPHETTGGLETVAIRMPSHPAAMKLIKDSGVYIAAPSANLSGRPSPTTAAHVEEDLSGRIDMILDGGPVGIGIESTIVDVTGDRPTILRPGYISADMIKNILGDVMIDPALESVDMKVRPKAPGMKYKHYAPKADMVIVDGPSDAVVSKINALVHQKQENGQKVAVIATEESGPSYHADVILSMGSRSNEDAIAQHLYKILRECDELHVDAIYSESFQTPRIGQAIMNRLLKAAGHTVIHCD